jgi:hypothetical protein
MPRPDVSSAFQTSTLSSSVVGKCSRTNSVAWRARARSCSCTKLRPRGAYRDPGTCCCEQLGTFWSRDRAAQTSASGCEHTLPPLAYQRRTLGRWRRRKDDCRSQSQQSRLLLRRTSVSRHRLDQLQQLGITRFCRAHFEHC